ncbi:MAG TPA: nuclear transport factor 2 family protein [Egibacteraceae bacterium]|nr:nuclear transport factor 2 family protein [Egibacteraceae bacterium]
MTGEHSDIPVLDVVQAHFEAFNTGDVNALMAGFADDAVFATGDHIVVGNRGIRAMFTDALRSLSPTLALRAAVVQGEVVACELSETIRVDGGAMEFALAAFYTVRRGQIVRVKVYREGSAEAPGGTPA